MQTNKPINSNQSVTLLKVTQADSPVSLEGSEFPCLITNEGATGSVTINLPTRISGGEKVTALCLASQTISISPTSLGRVIGLDGDAYGDLSDGSAITIDTKGQILSLTCLGRDTNGMIEWAAELQAKNTEIGNLSQVISDIVASLGDANGSYLISGGEVYYPESGLTLNVQAAAYYIGGTRYDSAADTVTLSAGDATHPRIDVIYVDNTGAVGVLEGTAAASPIKPQIDPSTQLELTQVNVASTATDLDDSISFEDIYLEDTEWTTTASNARITKNSTGDAFGGTKSVRFNAAQKNDYINFDKGSAVSLTTAAYVIIRYKPSGSSAGWLVARFLSSTNGHVGLQVSLTNGAFGLDTTSNTWQTIAIPITNFFPSIPTNVQKFQLWVNGTGQALTSGYVDSIQIQYGAELDASAQNNSWGTIVGDTGSASPETPGDTVTFAGAGGISITASGTTVTFTGGGSVDVDVTAGETLVAGNAVFVELAGGINTAGRAYKTDADSAFTSSDAWVAGIVKTGATAGNTAVVRVAGAVDWLSGLTAGTVYYASATAGALTGTAPTNAAALGIALNTTTLLLGVRRALTTNEDYDNSISPTSPSGSLAYMMGGTTSGSTLTTTDKITAASETTSNVAGAALAVAVSMAAPISASGSVYLAGGAEYLTSTDKNVVQKLTLGTETVSQLGATLSANRTECGSGVSSTHGYVLGGNQTPGDKGTVNTVEKLALANETFSAGTALGSVNHAFASFQSATHMYTQCGERSWSDSWHSAGTKIAMATDIESSISNAPEARFCCTGTSHYNNSGYHFGGLKYPGFAKQMTTVKTPFSTDTPAFEAAADLTAVTAVCATATMGSSKAFISGGGSLEAIGRDGLGTVYDTTYVLTFSNSTTTATAGANLSAARTMLTGGSNTGL